GGSGTAAAVFASDQRTTPVMKRIASLSTAGLLVASMAWATSGGAEFNGFTPLFNGKDLAGWKIPDGDNGHWKVVDGVIDYDAGSEATAQDKSLWSERTYGNFVLHVDWRIKA